MNARAAGGDRVVDAILFDLDGTLVQTRTASWELFAETNREFGLGIDSREAFLELFQENFFRSLERVCGDPDRLAAARAHFLHLLRTRYRPELIPGIADVVRSLAPHFTLAVLSTNTMATIRRLLGEAGIASCFAHVFAGDVEPDKGVAIRRFLADRTYGFRRACSAEYRETDGVTQPTADAVALVTDTVGDVKEALRCGIRAIGVAWGMHGEQQLLGAGAEMVAIWPQELVAWFVPDRRDRAAATCDAGGACEVHAGARSGEASLDERQAAAAQVRRRRRSQAAGDVATVVVPGPATPVSLDPALRRAVRRILRMPGAE
jgi:phosphoglycolate phosphatase